MAADPVVEYWAELMGRTPFTPEVMAQWKRVMDHGLEAWSRALSEVMATEDFAQLLGTSIEQWLATQASFVGKPAPFTGTPASVTGKPAPLTGQGDVLTGLAAEVRRLEERLRQLEERLASAAEPARTRSVQVSPSAQGSRRRTRRRRAA